MRKLIWNFLSELYPNILRFRFGMKIGQNCRISYKAKLDKSINPKGIYIGDNVWVLANSTILAHDYSRNLVCDTVIGNNVIIGINSLILPGVSLKDNTVVAAGSVVTKSFQSNVIIAGNPAKIIKEGVSVSNKGQII